MTVVISGSGAITGSDRAASGANADITSVTALTTIGGSSLAGNRNRIINGSMVIDQRNSGTAITPTTAVYTVDRWLFGPSVGSKLSLQQVTDAPAGFKYSLKATVASQYSPSSSDYFQLLQRIEGLNVIDFAFGTSGALTITLSAQVKSSVTGTYSVALRNSSFARSYIGTYTIAVANTWTPISITIIGDTTGTWLTDISTGIDVSFDLGSGTTFNATAGSWQAGNLLRTSGSVTFVNQTAGATWQLAAVQVEPGTIATAFERRFIQDELVLCQRYFNTSYQSQVPGTSSASVGRVVTLSASTSAYAYFLITFPVILRNQPTVVWYNPATGGTGNPIRDETVGTDFGTFALGTYSQNLIAIQAATAPGASHVMSVHYTASAEL